MVVTCEECGLKYQIDLEKITGESARFKCKGCPAMITVKKQEAVGEDDFDALEDTLMKGAMDGDSTEEDDFAALEDALMKGAMGGDSTEEDDSAALEEALIRGAAAGDSKDEDDLFGDFDTEATDDNENFTSQLPPHPVIAQPTKKRKGLGLATKVTLLMLLVSLLPGAIYFTASFRNTNNRIINETNEQGTLVSRLLTSEVDEWIDKNVRVLNALAKLPSIKSMNQFEQEEVLKSLQVEYPWMYLAFTTDTRGMNVARSDGKGLKDYSNRQYVKDVVEGKDLAWQNLIGKTSKKPALVLAVPIKNEDKIIGVMAAAMTRDALSKLVTAFVPGETGSSFLVDEKTKAVAHQNNTYVLSQKDMRDHALVQAGQQKITKRIDFIDANGKEAMGFARSTKLGWILAIQQEKAEAFAALKEAQMFAYALLGGTVIIILLIAYFASRAIVKPIKRLTDAANRISVGDLEVQIINNSKDEIGDLADAIMRMQDSIHLSISRLKRRKK